MAIFLNKSKKVNKIVSGKIDYGSRKSFETNFHKTYALPIKKRDYYYEHMALKCRVVQAITSIKNKYNNKEITRDQYKKIMSEVKPYILAYKKARFIRHASVILSALLTYSLYPLVFSTIGIPVAVSVIVPIIGSIYTTDKVCQGIYNFTHRNTKKDIPTL